MARQYFETPMTRADDTRARGGIPGDGQVLRVLLIEHRAAAAAAMRQLLGRAGMRTEWARSLAQAVAVQRSLAPHVALVDFELPDTNGEQVVRWLARLPGCGIIVLSDSADDADRSLGLEIGADDFLMKSTSPRELVARIRAVHRRVPDCPSGPVEPPELGVCIGSGRVDFHQRRMTDAAGRTIDITGAEFAVLEILVGAQGAIVSRDQLSERALRRPWRAEDRSIDQLIFGLRRKIPAAGNAESPIHTIRGAGYMIRVMDAA